MKKAIYLQCYDCMNELALDNDYKQMKLNYALMQLASDLQLIKLLDRINDCIIKVVDIFQKVYSWIKKKIKGFIEVLKTNKIFKFAFFHKKKRIRKKYLKKIKYF